CRTAAIPLLETCAKHNPSIQKTAEKAMSVNLNAVGNVVPLNIEGMDLEPAMMSVQSQRANLLEGQLKDQIASVQAKNDKMGKMNELLGMLNKAAAGMPSDAKAGDKVKMDAATTTEIKNAA